MCVSGPWIQTGQSGQLNCLPGKRLRPGTRTLHSFPSFLLFPLTNALSVLIALPPSFMQIKSSDTEWRSQLPGRRRPDKGCHKSWSQSNWWTRELKPRVLWSALLWGKLFFQFLFTRLYLGFNFTLYVPRTRRHKCLVSGFRRPWNIPSAEHFSKQKLKTTFLQNKILVSVSGTSCCHQFRV